MESRLTRIMKKTTSTGSVQSTSSSSDKPIPSYMRSTSSSVGRAASTPRSKSQEALTRTPSATGSRASADRKASTPMLKSSNKSQPSFDFSGTSSIGSIQKQPVGIGGVIPKQRVNLPSDPPKNFRRNLMSNMDKEAKGVPMKPVPLKVTHKTKPSESMTFEEEMVLECNKAAVLKAMYMNCKAQRSVKNAEGNALYQRLYLRECTKAMMEDIESLKRQKCELDSLRNYAPLLKESNETFAILNCVLESILRSLQALDDDLNRNSSLVLLNGLPSGDTLVSEEIKKTIRDSLSNPIMGKRTQVKCQELELMGSEAIKLSQLVSFIESLMKECQSLSKEVEKRMAYVRMFKKTLQEHGVSEE